MAGRSEFDNTKLKEFYSALESLNKKIKDAHLPVATQVWFVRDAVNLQEALEKNRYLHEDLAALRSLQDSYERELKNLPRALRSAEIELQEAQKASAANSAALNIGAGVANLLSLGAGSPGMVHDVGTPEGRIRQAESKIEEINRKTREYPVKKRQLNDLIKSLEDVIKLGEAVLDEKRTPEQKTAAQAHRKAAEKNDLLDQEIKRESASESKLDFRCVRIQKNNPKEDIDSIDADFDFIRKLTAAIDQFAKDYTAGQIAKGKTKTTDSGGFVGQVTELKNTIESIYMRDAGRMPSTAEHQARVHEVLRTIIEKVDDIVAKSGKKHAKTYLEKQPGKLMPGLFTRDKSTIGATLSTLQARCNDLCKGFEESHPGVKAANVNRRAGGAGASS